MSFVQAQGLVLLAVSPMLMKTSRERKMKFSTLGNADVKSVGRDKDVKKTEKQIADSRDDVWFKKKKKKVADCIVVKPKTKEIYSHVSRGQESVRPFWASAGWLLRLGRPHSMSKGKNLQASHFLSIGKLEKNF